MLNDLIESISDANEKLRPFVEKYERGELTSEAERIEARQVASEAANRLSEAGAALADTIGRYLAEVGPQITALYEMGVEQGLIAPVDEGREDQE